MNESAQSALRFYTEFSNPAKTTYSWNRSLPSSKDVFIAGDLAMYFGFASELDDIEKKSPHLNFDIAPVPQAKDAIARMTYGNMQAITVLKSSKNPTTTFYAASFMTSPEFNFVFSTISALPPPRRDLLRNIPPSAFGKYSIMVRSLHEVGLIPKKQPRIQDDGQYRQERIRTPLSVRPLLFLNQSVAMICTLGGCQCCAPAACIGAGWHRAVPTCGSRIDSLRVIDFIIVTGWLLLFTGRMVLYVRARGYGQSRHNVFDRFWGMSSSLAWLVVRTIDAFVGFSSGEFCQ